MDETDDRRPEFRYARDPSKSTGFRPGGESPFLSPYSPTPGELTSKEVREGLPRGDVVFGGLLPERPE